MTRPKLQQWSEQAHHKAVFVHNKETLSSDRYRDVFDPISAILFCHSSYSSQHHNSWSYIIL